MIMTDVYGFSFWKTTSRIDWKKLSRVFELIEEIELAVGTSIYWRASPVGIGTEIVLVVL